MSQADEPVVVETRETPPDPAIAKAIGQHHTLESAIADLIDNSIDAGAANILVRFLQRGGRIVGLRVIDDGKGMNDAGINAAMVFAGQRDYSASDLGHFGVGLKAASLSQANTLRVYSRDSSGTAVGRQIHAVTPTRLEILADVDADTFFTVVNTPFVTSHGTVVEWVDPKNFLSNGSPAEHTVWVENTVRQLLGHLGLVFHRILEAQSVVVHVDVYDVDAAQPGPARLVTPVDPFGYDQSVAEGYPATLELVLNHERVTAQAHIWPPGERHRPEFKLGEKSAEKFQGLYFYRADRLLQAGGSWQTLYEIRPEFELARVAIDLTDALKPHVKINPEKVGIEMDADLKQALSSATVQGTQGTFATYLATASELYKNAKKRGKKPVTLVQPDRGFSRKMLQAFGNTVEYSSGDAPVNVRWGVLPVGAPIKLDFDKRTIFINTKYRQALTGSDKKSDHDVPFVKALLLIAFSQYFEGQLWGARDKREIEAWEKLLSAAADQQFGDDAKTEGEPS
ncbi:MAG: ATP-binding protein [Microbacteriaceae bacterium]